MNRWPSLLILTMAGCASVPWGHTGSGETSALVALERLKRAQASYKTEHHRFGTLDDLVNTSAECRDAVARARQRGYDIAVDAEVSRYSVQAVPRARAPGSRRSFYLDQTGLVRHSWNEQPAGRDSPELR